MKLRNRRLPLAVLLTTILLLGGQVRAESLVDCSLKGISKVQIVVVTAGLQYEAIPKLDLHRLESAVERAVTDHLAKNAVRAVNESELTLLITFNKIKTADGSYLIITRVRLTEPARIDRLAKSMPERSDVVTSWESWQWERSAASDVTKTILGSIEITCRDFGEAVARAAHGGDC